VPFGFVLVRVRVRGTIVQGWSLRNYSTVAVASLAPCSSVHLLKVIVCVNYYPTYDVRVIYKSEGFIQEAAQSRIVGCVVVSIHWGPELFEVGIAADELLERRVHPRVAVGPRQLLRFF